MILNKEYNETTKGEKIQYNRQQIEVIKQCIDSMPLMYCSGIDCYECPLNISPKDSKQINCLTQITIIR